jgi:hypothetical protein
MLEKGTRETPMIERKKTFRLPTKEEVASIGEELALTEKQVHELHLTLMHVHADTAWFFEKKLDRQEKIRGVQRLEEFHTALKNLMGAIGTDMDEIDQLNECLPFEAREAIGLSVNQELGGITSGREVESLDSEAAKRSIGLLHGTRLLMAVLRQIDAPLENWFKEKVNDPGGVEPDYLRSFLVESLAKSAMDIIGARATATVGGMFYKLVTEVFIACDVDDSGFESLIERVLKKLRYAIQ